jgi:hypothetical protein
MKYYLLFSQAHSDLGYQLLRNFTDSPLELSTFKSSATFENSFQQSFTVQKYQVII